MADHIVIIGGGPGGYEAAHVAAQLGADVTINYKTTPEWGKLARQQTGIGVDLVVEVGGVCTLNGSIRALKICGTIAFIGVLAGRPDSESRLPLMVMQQQRLQGVTVGSVEQLVAPRT